MFQPPLKIGVAMGPGSGQLHVIVSYWKKLLRENLITKADSGDRYLINPSPFPSSYLEYEDCLEKVQPLLT